VRVGRGAETCYSVSSMVRNTSTSSGVLLDRSRWYILVEARPVAQLSRVQTQQESPCRSAP